MNLCLESLASVRVSREGFVLVLKALPVTLNRPEGVAFQYLRSAFLC